MYNKDSYQFNINKGVIYGNIIQCLNPNLDTDVDKRTYKYHITFKYDNTYSRIDVEYAKDINNKLKFKGYNMTELRDKSSVKYENISDIWTLIDRINKWKGKLQSLWMYSNNLKSKLYDINSYDFMYFFMDLHYKRFCQLGVNNLILSVPKEIEDYKSFTIIFGCLLTPELYNQVNINYNYNGYMTSLDFYEYRPPPSNVINNFMILEMLRKLFICN
jgi:hypothetical protein